MRSALLAICCSTLLVAAAVDSAAAQSIESVSRTRFRDLTIPFDGKLKTHFFGPAQGKGERVRLQVKGDAILHIARVATVLPAAVAITIEVRNMDSAVVARQATPPAALDSIGLIERVSLADNHVVEVSVADAGEGGPTGSSPYTLMLEVWPVSPGGAVAILDTTTVMPRPDTPPRCEVLANGTIRRDYAEVVATLDPATWATDVPKVFVFEAGGRVDVEVPEDWDAAATHIRLFVKGPGEGAYFPVCSDVSIESGSRVVEGTAPHIGQGATWRAEIRKNAQSLGGVARILRERDLRGMPQINDVEAQSYLCVEEQGFVSYRQQDSVVPIANRAVLNIDLDSALAGSVREAFVATVIRSATIWLRSCLGCAPASLAIVRVDGRTFIHPGLAALLPRGVVPVPMIPDPRRLEELLLSFLGAERVGIHVPYQAYVEAKTPLPIMFKTLCDAYPMAPRDGVAAQILPLLCSLQPSEPRSIAAIRVRFKDGLTYCGDDTDIIACRADRLLTEYNIRDYRFEANGGLGYGSGAVTLNFLPIVLHEMGHWIGLEHVNEGSSIMAESAEQARCVNWATVEALRTAMSVGADRGIVASAFRLHRRP